MYEGSGRIVSEGPRADSLTEMEFEEDSEFGTVTQDCVPTHQPLEVHGDAVYMSCAALNGLDASTANEGNFQVNCVMLEAPLSRDLIYTQKGDRLFFVATLRDSTGPVEVFVVEKAAPPVFGLQTPQEVHTCVAEGSLALCRRRLNVRGVCRIEKGFVKLYIAETVPCSNTEWISEVAFHQSMGLARIQCDVVVPSPFKFIKDCSLLGLAVEPPMQTRTGAYRVIVLVEGTTGSKLTRLEVGGGEEAFLVESPKVRCLLSGEACFADLRGYCDFNSVLQYRLDKEIALASISSCAVASGTGLPCFTIEHMEKVSRDDK